MPRYVLLEHRWQGVHWDFMLERADGQTLMTWAVDRPIAPGRALPARRLPDHRPAYLDYEGEISGGRGSVIRVDRGDYVVLEWEADRVVVLVRGGQLAGRVELTLTREAGRTGESDPGGENWGFRLKSGNFD